MFIGFGGISLNFSVGGGVSNLGGFGDDVGLGVGEVMLMI